MLKATWDRDTINDRYIVYLGYTGDDKQMLKPRLVRATAIRGHAVGQVALINSLSQSVRLAIYEDLSPWRGVEVYF